MLIVRLATIFLILVIVLPIFALSGDPADPDGVLANEFPTATVTPSPEVTATIEPTATLFPTEPATPNIGVTPSPTENGSSSTPTLTVALVGTQPIDPTAAVPAVPGLITTSTESAGTLSPEVIDTLQPTITLLPMETATLNVGLTPFPTLEPSLIPTTLPTALPFPTLDLSTAIASESASGLPTEEATEAATTPPTTLPTDMPTLEATTLPTALPFPTVDLSTVVAPTTIPTAALLTLPALATLDDGASDWLGSPKWALQPYENGLAWVMTGTSSEQLRWQTPIDLRSAIPSVVLSFQSWFVGDGLALVQVSTDGLNWQQVSVVLASDRWTSISVDLSHYIGSVIQIGFAWQDTNVETQDQWVVDMVLVAEVTPTLNPPGVPIVSTATVFSPTEIWTVTTIALTPTVHPSDAPTEVAPTEAITETVVEPRPTDVLTATSTATNTEVAGTASPVVIETVSPTATLFPSETATPEIDVTLFPTEDASGGTPAVTAELVGTQLVDPTEEITALPELTATSTESVPVMMTEQAAPVSVACQLDLDLDGTVTESDLSQIGREILNTDVSETTMIYDLNGNHQIDIGDLQRMASYLFETCSD